MAYWQNGKVFVHCSTQSTSQTVPGVARWLNVDPDKVVVISEYTGGGFGSKITSAISLLIPALLSKKANAPVMLRISREEEHYIGRARPGLLGRMKVGFSKEGKITALDMFVITDSGPYDPAGDGRQAGNVVSLLYQIPAMRWRGVTVITNTPPRAAQSSPGGMQGITLMEPVFAKAARKLGLDQVAIRKDQCRRGQGPVRTDRSQRQARVHHQLLYEGSARPRRRKAIQLGGKRKAQPKKMGTNVRCVGVSMSTFVGGSTGYDGLFVIKPDGKVYIQTGIGNLGTESWSDCQRVIAEILNVPWEKCELTWGSTAKNLPWSCASGGSQTTHAMTRAAHAVGMDGKAKLQEIAAKKLGGQPENYELINEKVVRKGGGASMTFAQAAQYAIDLGGKYDGHELPKDINKFTVASASALSGQGLMGVARDSYPHDGQTYSFVAAFARSRGRYRNRCVSHHGFPGGGRRGHRAPSARSGRADSGPVDAGDCSRYRAKVGLRSALRAAACEAVPLQQAAHDSRCSRGHEVGCAQPSGS